MQRKPQRGEHAKTEFHLFSSVKISLSLLIVFSSVVMQTYPERLREAAVLQGNPHLPSADPQVDKFFGTGVPISYFTHTASCQIAGESGDETYVLMAVPG